MRRLRHDQRAGCADARVSGGARIEGCTRSRRPRARRSTSPSCRTRDRVASGWSPTPRPSTIPTCSSSACERDSPRSSPSVDRERSAGGCGRLTTGDPTVVDEPTRDHPPPRAAAPTAASARGRRRCALEPSPRSPTRRRDYLGTSHRQRRRAIGGRPRPRRARRAVLAPRRLRGAARQRRHDRCSGTPPRSASSSGAAEHLVCGEFSSKFAAVTRAAPHLDDPDGDRDRARARTRRASTDRRRRRVRATRTTRRRPA